MTAIYAPAIAASYGLVDGPGVISIHCGFLGQGHQIGTDYLKRMGVAAARHGITLPDRELDCAPLDSDDKAKTWNYRATTHGP